jgi:hypothetical protein
MGTGDAVDSSLSVGAGGAVTVSFVVATDEATGSDFGVDKGEAVDAEGVGVGKTLPGTIEGTGVL